MSRPKLFYVRHGETAWNAEGRVQGWRDIPLNERGRGQATAAGGVLLELLTRDGRAPGDFDYVSSPLGRARATMDLVRAKLGLPAEGYRIYDDLREISYGDWEGLTYPEMQQRDPVLFASRAADKWGIAPPSGEAYASVMTRLQAWSDGLAADTVVVAHGGTMRALMAALGIMSQPDVLDYRVEQGVVYVFADGTMARYA